MTLIGRSAWFYGFGHYLPVPGIITQPAEGSSVECSTLLSLFLPAACRLSIVRDVRSKIHHREQAQHIKQQPADALQSYSQKPSSIHTLLLTTSPFRAR